MLSDKIHGFEKSVVLIDILPIFGQTSACGPAEQFLVNEIRNLLYRMSNTNFANFIVIITSCFQTLQ